jgi:hypothetical protein
MIHLGYHLEETFEHLFLKEPSTDYLEMCLHHIATITLYGGMLLNNALRVGVIISWIHDLSDVPIALS